MPTDPARLLSALSRTLESLDIATGELEQRLDELVAVASAIFDVDGAGLMLVDAQSRLRLVGASDEAGRALELAQQETGDGPGIEATHRRELVAISDLSQEERWAKINDAVAPHGVVSVISAPISIGGEGVGNLNLFAAAVRDWTLAEREGIRAFAGVAAALLRVALEAEHGGGLVSELSERLSSGHLGPGEDTGASQ